MIDISIRNICSDLLSAFTEVSESTNYAFYYPTYFFQSSDPLLEYGCQFYVIDILEPTQTQIIFQTIPSLLDLSEVF